MIDKKTNNWQVVMICFVFILSSCTSIYFESPQPLDSKDLKKFPKELRGFWLDGLDTVSVKKDQLITIKNEIKKISRTELETSNVLIMKNNQIFELNSNSLKGYRCSILGDTILYSKRLIDKINIGDSLKLRSSAKYYFLNRLNENGWWEVTLVHQSDKNTMLLKYPNKDEFELASKISSFALTKFIESDNPDGTVSMTNHHGKYWRGNFTSKEIIQFINEGGFSDTLQVFKRKMNK
jgi:hypothetical protein